MYTFAFLCITLAMFACLCGAAFTAVFLWRRPVATATPNAGGKRRGARAALVAAGPEQGGRELAALERVNLWVTLGFVLASLILVRALYAHDFSLVYVASYTDRVLPLFYRLTAFWAGQAGSMLFWALAVVLCGAAFQFTASYRGLSVETRLWYWTFYLSLIAFFGLLLVTWNNPFLVSHAVPRDGNGLNPLLQNPGMIFHPPLLLLGYGGFVIPGCLALAQSMSARGTEETPWPDVARPFTMSGWAFLTAGIALGAWWAYMELGWGGYWAWDPVENASLIPWLTATAALHTLVIQTRRGKLHGVNVFLMALTTISALFATYLVRSGVVQSVHAFGQGQIGSMLLAFIAFSTVAALLIARRATHRNSSGLAGADSRDFYLLLTTWTLLALAAIILIATLWPVLTAFWQETVQGLAPARQLDAAGHDHGGAKGLTPAFYNRVCMPLFAGVVLLLAICPWIGWKGGITRKRSFFIALGAIVASGVVLFALGYTLPVPLAGMAGGIGCIASLALLAAQRRFRMDRGTLAALGIHLGLALIAVGIAFSGPYKKETQSSLAVGERVQVGPFDVLFKNLYEGQGPGYVFVEGELEVSRDGRVIGIASPQRRVYSKWGQMQFAEAATVPSLGEEFYASLAAVDRQGKAMFSLSVHPLVNWLWIGGALMSLLPFLSLRARHGHRTKGNGAADCAESGDVTPCSGLASESCSRPDPGACGTDESDLKDAVPGRAGPKSAPVRKKKSGGRA